jgi:UTP--glucose-1-phosphate uridylyltransferase
MKGVIIAAGYGTRFLPGTKTIPKEMFPLVDTPAIQLIVDEFLAAGIKDILIVTSRRKKSMEDYFDREVELEGVFSKENADSKLSLIAPAEANIFFSRQMEMKGTGQAILQCKPFVGDDSFVVAYPDDIVFADVPLAAQLIKVYNETGCSVLSAQKIDGDVSRYGVLDCNEDDKILKVAGIVEKPAKGTEPSHMISIGRYLFTPELFSLLEEDYKKYSGGEFYHIGAINALAKAGKMRACCFDGERIDVGDKLGYIEGILRYALTRADLKDETVNIMKRLVK